MKKLEISQMENLQGSSCWGQKMSSDRGIALMLFANCFGPEAAIVAALGVGLTCL